MGQYPALWSVDSECALCCGENLSTVFEPFNFGACNINIIVILWDNNQILFFLLRIRI